MYLQRLLHNTLCNNIQTMLQVRSVNSGTNTDLEVIYTPAKLFPMLTRPTLPYGCSYVQLEAVFSCFPRAHTEYFFTQWLVQHTQSRGTSTNWTQLSTIQDAMDPGQCIFCNWHLRNPLSARVNSVRSPDRSFVMRSS